jgi:ribosomal protein L11 methyltransferase
MSNAAAGSDAICDVSTEGGPVLALVVTVPASEAELAADVLWDLGVAAIEERVEGAASAMVELWTSLGDDSSAVAAAAEGFPERWQWRLVEIDPAVVDTWRRHAVPTWVADDLVVVPSWHPDASPPPVTGITRILIDPGSSFGLGDHPTTVASLRALRAVQWPGARVLDVGCGSGVLGIAAALAGAVEVRAIDVSIPAVEATSANAERNGVAHVVSVDTAPVGVLDGSYDVVLANILAPTLVDLADDLRRLVAPGGVLIVSGILADRYEHVAAALMPMHVIDRLVKDGWVALVLRH